MSPQAQNEAEPAVLVEIASDRVPVRTLVGAVDAVLRSELSRLSVRVELAEADPRREVVQALCGADPRVTLAGPGEPVPEAAITFEVPARARPQPRTLPAIAELMRSEGLGAVEVPVPGRFASRSRAGKVRAVATGTGAKRLRASELGLRSVLSRGEPSPPPTGALAAERAEHLRHRARGATMRARMDRNAHRLSRERLQTRHERARLRLAEQRLGESGPAQWVAWRSRAAARLGGRAVAAAGSAAGSARTFGRRARRFALDRWRSRGATQS